MFSLKKLALPVPVGAALLLAACGGSAHRSSSTAAATSASAGASQPATGGGLALGTAGGGGRTHLTGASGRALYLWVADARGRSTCFGACAQAWPPLTAGSAPHVTGGLQADDVSLISRGNGTKQVAYYGHPLYYFAGDTGAGTTRGQGSDGFGAKWWLVAPSGSAIKTGASGTGAAAGGSSGRSYGGGSSGSSYGGGS